VFAWLFFHQLNTVLFNCSSNFPNKAITTKFFFEHNGRQIKQNFVILISKENYVFSDLFPQFVLKLDDHFEDDFASFSEDTGIEELGIDVDFFTKTSLPNDEQVGLFC
jgi:hypothetical protein